MKVVWTDRAKLNRTEQIGFIAVEQPAAAIRIDEEIERQTRLLRNTPEIGRPGRVAGTRELVIARTPFVVIYRMHHEAVQILRLLHGAQLWPPFREK